MERIRYEITAGKWEDMVLVLGKICQIEAIHCTEMGMKIRLYQSYCLKDGDYDRTIRDIIERLKGDAENRFMARRASMNNYFNIPTSYYNPTTGWMTVDSMQGWSTTGHQNFSIHPNFTTGADPTQ